MKVDEMIRLACLYAERDQLELLDAMKGCDMPEDRKAKREIRAFLKKLRAYRLKRWGRTKLEKAIAEAEEVAVLPRRDADAR